jgi:hypothetical protein
VVLASLKGEDGFASEYDSGDKVKNPGKLQKKKGITVMLLSFLHADPQYIYTRQNSCSSATDLYFRETTI